jgi:hypothetical protein
MTRRMSGIFIVCLFTLAPVACLGETSRGECRFHQPSQVVKLPAEYYQGLDIARRDSEPEMLLYATSRLSDDNKTQEVMRVFTGTRQFDREWIPYEAEPAGYTWFADSPYHPLIKSGKIHFEYLGEKSQIVVPMSDIDGRLRFENRDHFTGTRRLMYGTRPLLEQDLTNWTQIVGVSTFVQLEPDGDRIVLFCSDKGGAKLAVFSRSQLDRDQNAGEKR